MTEKISKVHNAILQLFQGSDESVQEKLTIKNDKLYLENEDKWSIYEVAKISPIIEEHDCIGVLEDSKTLKIWEM